MSNPTEESKPMQMLTFDLIKDEPHGHQSSIVHVWKMMVQSAGDMTGWCNDNMALCGVTLLAGSALAVGAVLAWHYRDSIYAFFGAKKKD